MRHSWMILACISLAMRLTAQTVTPTAIATPTATVSPTATPTTIDNLSVKNQYVQMIKGNSDAPRNLIAGVRSVTNTGDGVTAQYNGAWRDQYISLETIIPPGRFDVGAVYLASVDASTAQGPYEGAWMAYASPRDPSGRWTYFGVEENIGNRAVDMGYRGDIHGVRCTGGRLMVSTAPFVFGPVNTSKNVDFGWGVAGGKNQTQAQFYNGYLVNPDAIAKNGRGIALGGDTARYTDATPYAPAEVTKRWETGIRMERAKLKDNAAMTIGATHNIKRTDGKMAVFLTDAEASKLKALLQR